MGNSWVRAANPATKGEKKVRNDMALPVKVDAGFLFALGLVFVVLIFRVVAFLSPFMIVLHIVLLPEYQ